MLLFFYVLLLLFCLESLSVHVVTKSELEALLTLHLGPVQTSPIWFARSRLGISIFACKVWGDGIEDAAGV